MSNQQLQHLIQITIRTLKIQIVQRVKNLGTLALGVKILNNRLLCHNSILCYLIMREIQLKWEVLEETLQMLSKEC